MSRPSLERGEGHYVYYFQNNFYNYRRESDVSFKSHKHDQKKRVDFPFLMTMHGDIILNKVKYLSLKFCSLALRINN